MTFDNALDGQTELIGQVGKKLAHLTMGVGLFLQEANLLALAADGITEDRQDKKIDFIINDEDNNRLIFAQGYCADVTKDKAPANKASDLNTAAAWLVSGDESKLPDKLKAKILRFRELLHSGLIHEIDLLYVHNCPESLSVDEELSTVAEHLRHSLKDQNIDVRSHELGSARLEHLFSAQNSFIEINDAINLPEALALKHTGQSWSGAVTTVSGRWIADLYARYGDKLYSANYRGFLGMTRRKGVNAGIRDTIQNKPNEFWAFNNGITILTRKIKTEGRNPEIEGISIINGAQTSGTIGNCIDLREVGSISLLCKVIESNDEETIKNIVRFNNTQNAITSWDQYANDEQQKRLESEFTEINFAYLKKRGFAQSGEQITIDSVFQPVLAFHGKSRDAVRGKSQLFENISLYENAFHKTKARHILLAFVLSRAIDHVRLSLKSDKQTVGDLGGFNEKQLSLLTNLNFKPFLIDVISHNLEIIRSKRTDRKTVAFSSDVAKVGDLAALIALCVPVVTKVLALLSIRIEAESFFSRHSDDDAFMIAVASEVGATLVAAGVVAQLNGFASALSDN